MVKGFETFRIAFLGYEDCYTIIGGTACDILMNEAGLSFRATKDIDMILLIENRFEEFGSVFWKYIKDGGYRFGWKTSDDICFYRFSEPTVPNYPLMIELFSKRPNYSLHDESSIFVPIHISDGISSLSAILLSEEYYYFMMMGRKIVDGIGVLGAEYLIPFKAKAWIDLTAKKKAGVHVNTDDLKKHKNDVFRLFNLIGEEQRIDLPKEINNDMKTFIEAMSIERINLKNLGLELHLEEVLHILRDVYLV